MTARALDAGRVREFSSARRAYSLSAKPAVVLLKTGVTIKSATRSVWAVAAMNAKPGSSPFRNHTAAGRAGQHGPPLLGAVGLRFRGHHEQRSVHAVEAGLLAHFPALAASMPSRRSCESDRGAATGATTGFSSSSRKSKGEM